MANIKTIAVVHNNDGIDIVEGIVTTNMTQEDYIMHINRMRREMMRMQKEYNNLLGIAKTLERQRNRLLREKFAILEEELQPSYLRRLFGK